VVGKERGTAAEVARCWMVKSCSPENGVCGGKDGNNGVQAQQHAMSKHESEKDISKRDGKTQRESKPAELIACRPGKRRPHIRTPTPKRYRKERKHCQL
jgi:hypothetical protein